MVYHSILALILDTIQKEYFMHLLSIRVDSSTEEYLRKLCQENEDKSLNLSAKNLLKWCQSNNIDPSKNHSQFDDEVRKMIEHIHLSMPHVMMSSYMSLQGSFSGLAQEKKDELYKKGTSFLNQNMGDFQNVEYKNVRVTYNPIGLKRAPEDEEYSEWK